MRFSFRLSKVFKVFKDEKQHVSSKRVVKDYEISSHQKDDEIPSLEQTLTMTTSIDSEDDPTSEDVIGSSRKESIITFTEREVMQNELNHMRELNIAEERIRELSNTIEELETAHFHQISQLEQEWEISDKRFDSLLYEMEDELKRVQQELQERKNELMTTSVVLMRCQHELHELKSSRSWNIRGIWQ
jgi:hypothetical protein